VTERTRAVKSRYVDCAKHEDLESLKSIFAIMERAFNLGRKRGSSLSPDETRILSAFIKKLCKHLKVKPNVMWSALVFFHRFHSRHIAGGGGIQYDEFDLATSSVFLACKVEENIQKLERILDVAHEIRTSETKPLSENPEHMWKTRERTLICERILLDTISFNIVVEHAHAHANKFSAQVANGDQNEWKSLRQISSNILNDSLSTNLCMRHEPLLIGAAAVRLAGRFLKARSSQQQASIIRLEEMEANGKIFGFPATELLKVEDELISTYEAGIGSLAPEGGKRARMAASPNSEDVQMN